MKRISVEYAESHPGRNVKFDPKANGMLVKNLAGLTHGDAAHLARNAIYNDGAISSSDLPGVMQAKYELLNKAGHSAFRIRHGEIQ